MSGSEAVATTPAGPAPASGPRPIRVLHVITRMIVGGAQENTMLSCALIDRARFPSEILTGPQTGVEGELFGETRARGVTLHVEPFLVREISPVKDLVALYRLTSFIRRGRYDVVHTHCSKAGILGRIAAWLANTPVIVHTMHGLPFNPAQSKPAFWANVWLERLCVQISDAVPMVAAPDLDETIALGIGRPEQYSVIRSGIEIEAYRDVPIGRDEARARLGIPAGAFVVGFVGRLSFQKAPLDMIEAFRRIAGAVPDAHLVMAGDGDLRAECQAAIDAGGHGARVHLLGLRRDVPELMRAFDVLALPSRFEGMPRVFPQAMAARLPIVATRVDGAIEAIVPGENGWLVDVGDVGGFADRLLAVASDREGARRMGERGFERVEEFSARGMVSRLETLYAALARRKGVLPSIGAPIPETAPRVCDQNAS
jgi:glycosyltransferase involved in cell wall biosynthesis